LRFGVRVWGVGVKAARGGGWRGAYTLELSAIEAERYEQEECPDIQAGT